MALDDIAEEVVPDGPGQYGESTSSRGEHDTQIAKRPRLAHTCEHCNTSYTEKRALARHCQTDLHRQKLGLPLAQKYRCHVCGKYFTREYDRARHENEKHRGAKRGTARHAVEDFYAIPRHNDDTCSQDLTSDMPARSTSAVQSILQSRFDTMIDSNEDDITSDTWLERNHLESSLGFSECVRGAFALRSSSSIDSIGHIANDTMSSDESGTSITPSAIDSAIDMTSDEFTVPGLAIAEATVIEGSLVQAPRKKSNSIDIGSLLDLPVQFHDSVVQRHGRTRSLARRRTLFCAFCGGPFEEARDDLLAHVRRHLDLLKGAFHCNDCRVEFVREQDLLFHQRSVATDYHCGFNFRHRHPCPGHHPPEADNVNDSLSDWDSFRLCMRLRHWEQWQLKVYVASISDLLSTPTPKDIDSYSVEVLYQRSLTSMESLTISVKTHASAPCDKAMDGELDSHGLQQRLRTMSLRKSRDQVWQNVKLVPLLVRTGNVNKALFEALCSCDGLEVQHLLKRGATLKAMSSPQISYGVKEALMSKNGWGVLRDLIAGGVVALDIRGKHSKIGLYLLEAAVCNGETEIFTLLCAQGVDPSCVSDNALFQAAHFRHAEVIKMLQQAGVCKDWRTGLCKATLCYAISRNSPSAVETLLKCGVDTWQTCHAHETMIDGQHPLAFAVTNGQIEITKLLLVHDANPTLIPFGPNSLLEMAALNCHAEIVRLLLLYGANDYRFFQPLNHPAKWYFYGIMETVIRLGHTQVVEVMLAHGADVNYSACNRGSLLATAAYFGRAAIVELLLQHGAAVNDQIGMYGTALCAVMVAARRGFGESHTEVLKILLDFKADVTLQGPHGSPMDLVQEAVGYSLRVDPARLKECADSPSHACSGLDGYPAGVWHWYQDKDDPPLPSPRNYYAPDVARERFARLIGILQGHDEIALS